MPTPDENHAIHPLVLSLLRGIEYVADGHTRIPAGLLKVAEHGLRANQEDTPFFDLLCVWHRLHAAGVQPAGQQLLNILKVFPQVREVQSAHQMAQLARKVLTDRVDRPTTQAGVTKPRTFGVNLRSSRKP